MIVCVCAGASERDVRAAIHSGAGCMTSLQERGIGAGCGSCHSDLRSMLRAAGADEASLWCHLEHVETDEHAAIA
ncbi:MAG: bacterioferritin-associated ferredoxin [Thermoanaerobaculia bacterium]